MDTFATTLKALKTSSSYLETGRPGLAWAHLARAERLVEQGRRELIAALRNSGQTWGQIAATVGEPKPTLHRRYRCVDDDAALNVAEDQVLSRAWAAVASLPQQRSPSMAEVFDAQQPGETLTAALQRLSAG